MSIQALTNSTDTIPFSALDDMVIDDATDYARALWVSNIDVNRVAIHKLTVVHIAIARLGLVCGPLEFALISD